MYKHILIATDGSELAGKGVEHGLALAKPLGAKVTVLTVTEPLPVEAVEDAKRESVRDPLGGYEHQMDQYVATLMKGVKATASGLGVAIEINRETDRSPAEAIVRSARLNGCDLIVMASHGRRGINKLILGSQTSEVLALTTIPVLVVR
jgi:nucleotide-binding universal stress UspA family protein